MEIEDLKYVVGAVEPDKPAVVRFFTSVHEESITRLIDEILWLQECVKPSKIVLMINSEGGSVLYGMSAFSTLLACPIEIDCIVEGIAASMGSVLWAAGDNLYMHDYSLLMIHNPFNARCCDDPATNQMVNAFRNQLMTVYCKRFGMTKEQASKIMDGEEGADGTFFTAKEAVKAGLLPADHVIKTSKQVRDKVKNAIEGVSDMASLQNLMSDVAAELDENKLLENLSAIHNRKDNIHIQEHNEMNEEQTLNFNAVSALLGFSADAQLAAVTERVNTLLGTEATLATVQGELNDLKIQYAGKETELNNVKSELEEVKASLKTYQDAEAQAREAEMLQTVQDAIDAGKIEDSAKAEWLEMAHTNFELVKKTLATINGRDDINKDIADTPENVDDINNTLTDVEKKMQEAIVAHLGEITFKKF